MKTFANHFLETYGVNNLDLYIRWNVVERTEKTPAGETITCWEANEALCKITDDRASLIEKIIGSVYSHAAEIAIINNKETKSEEYAKYQAFRVQAKALADGWLNKE
jgi:hypothetical protein